MQRNKLGNKKTVIDGIIFDSMREAKRYGELKLLLRAGAISDLELQKVYELIPAYYEEVETGEVYKIGKKKGQKKTKQRTVEQAVTYAADFVYKKDGETIVEDTKGFRTKDYIIKRKLMFHVYGIRIVET